MRKLALPLVVGVAMLAGTASHAQTFTYDVTWNPVESVGGMNGEDGRQYGGGVVTGTYSANYADGTERSGSMKCVGMGQPDGGIFAIHMTCTATSGEAKTTLVYGCNYLGPRGPGTPLGCIGGIEGQAGAAEGRRGSVTMEWYSATKSRGTGQWYAAGE